METIIKSKPGFIRDYSGNVLLPITRAELIKNADGSDALRIVKAHDQNNGTTGGYPGLMDPTTLATILAKIDGSGTNSLADLVGQINKIKDSIEIDGTACNLLEDVLNFADSDNIVVSKDASNNIKFDFSTSVAFNEAKVSASPSEDTDVVNKAALVKALDDKFKEALSVASGALHFKGGISALPGTLEEGAYYKVTANFNYTQDSKTVHAEVGDTLIYANNAWIHIPSGNETETFIKGTSGIAINGGINITTTANSSGLITAKTSVGSDGYSGDLELDLRAASISGNTVTPGYFNQAIYNNLKNLIPASSTYTPIVTSGHQIGKFVVNSTETPVVIPKLVVDNTTEAAPKIKYQGATEAISINATKGVVASASSQDNSITIGLNVASNQPLAVNASGALALNVWKTGDIDNKQGLITFETFASGLFDNVLFIEVSNPSQLDETEQGYLEY